MTERYTGIGMTKKQVDDHLKRVEAHHKKYIASLKKELKDSQSVVRGRAYITKMLRDGGKRIVRRIEMDNIKIIKNLIDIAERKMIKVREEHALIRRYAKD